MPSASKAYTQEELLIMIRKKDPASFNVLYDTYAPVLYCITSKSCNDTKICEDILQKSLIRIWQGLENYDPSKQRFLAWMLEIARDIAAETFKANNVNKNSEIQTSTNNVSKNKEVLTLIYFKGYSLNKAAEVLNMSIEELKIKLKLEFDQLRR